MEVITIITRLNTNKNMISSLPTFSKPLHTHILKTMIGSINNTQSVLSNFRNRISQKKLPKRRYITESSNTYKLLIKIGDGLSIFKIESFQKDSFLFSTLSWMDCNCFQQKTSLDQTSKRYLHTK